MSSKKQVIADLPSGIGIYGSSASGWRVRLGRKFTGGSVIRKRFESVKSAREWIFGDAQKDRVQVPIVPLKLEAGNSAFRLTQSQLAEAVNAFKRLDGYGSLTDAVAYFLKYAHPVGGNKNVQEAADHFLNIKKQANRDPKYINLLGAIFETFAEDFGQDMVASIRREQVEEWLAELEFSPTTISNYIRYLRALFTDAINRKWAVENPFQGIQPPSIAPEEIRVLKPCEAERLLQAASLHSPTLAVCAAIKLYAGLRTSELIRLNWLEVRESEIHIKAKNAKTRQRRLVTIQPILAAWLKLAARKEGKVWPASQDAFHLALSDAADGGGVALSQNILRHSFGSYLFAKSKNENLVSSEMGNTPQMVFAHYRGMVSEQECKEFWKLS